MRLFISINSQGSIFNQVTARSHTVIKFEAQLLLYKSMAQTGLLQENPQGCQDWYREVEGRVQRGLLRLYYNRERSPGQVLLLGSAGPAGPGLHPSRHASSISHSIAKKIMSPPCKRRCKDACKWVLAPGKINASWTSASGAGAGTAPRYISGSRPYLAALCRAGARLGAAGQL